MSSILKWREIFIYLFFFPFLNSCTRPEDNAIKPLRQYVPSQDSIRALASVSHLPKIDTIEISGMQFHPGEVKVHKGDTIVWKNDDLVAHCVTGTKSNAWTSSKINAGASWKMGVDISSDYFCAIHLVMKGKIIVE